MQARASVHRVSPGGRMRAWIVSTVVSFALPALAGTPTDPPPAAEKKQADDTSGRTLAASLVSGSVESFDKETGKLLVQAGGKREEFLLDGQATVFLAGRLGEIGDVVSGKQVRLAWEVREKVRAVRWIEVMGDQAPTRRTQTPGDGVSGTVVSRDVEKRLLVLRQGTAEWSLALDESASVVVQGAPAGLEALVPGDEVRANYEPGVPSVLRIERVTQ